MLEPLPAKSRHLFQKATGPKDRGGPGLGLGPLPARSGRMAQAEKNLALRFAIQRYVIRDRLMRNEAAEYGRLFCVALTEHLRRK